MTHSIHWFGRMLGVACGAVLAAAWAFALWAPSAELALAAPSTGLSLTGIGFVIAVLLLVAFAVFASIAAAHGHAAVVALFFLGSFFPIGAFLMLRSDHWLRWVGWVDLGLLLAAALIWATRRRLVASGAP
jgi:hypothetical protein